MNYDYYRIFYYVARRRSFTGAAEALGSSQPNVTRCMNNLEFELGCKLFERSNRGVKLTPEGAALYERVRAAQQQLEAAERELEQRKCLERGEISVGASETALHLALLPALKKFRRSHPQIRVRVANYSTPQAVAALRRGEVELALATTPTGAEPPLSETALSCFQEILVGGPLYAELAGRTLSLGDLRDYPLVCLGRGTMTFEFYDMLFLRQGLDLRPDVEAATMDQVLPMVRADLGLGFIPEAFAREALESQEVFRIELAEPIPPRRVCLVEDQERTLSMAALELKKLLAAAGN